MFKTSSHSCSSRPVAARSIDQAALDWIPVIFILRQHGFQIERAILFASAIAISTRGFSSIILCNHDPVFCSTARGQPIG